MICTLKIDEKHSRTHNFGSIANKKKCKESEILLVSKEALMYHTVFCSQGKLHRAFLDKGT